MNSIVQEASSISKAIEQAWEKAGKPEKFSIRVFEEPQKNFFGMLNKPAKIAIFFEKRDVLHQPSNQQPTKQVAQKREEPKKRFEEPKIVLPVEKKAPEATEKKQKVFWTDEMTQKAEQWMKGMLVQMKKQNITFSTETKRYHIKFQFKDPLFADKEKQKNLFRNFSLLVMQSVRNKFKKQFRYHKVVITSEK